MKKILVLFFLAFFSLSAIGQQPYSISGKVIDNNTRAGLPFVNLIVTGHPQLGATADIDGNFKISAAFHITSLSFSYIGYQDMVLSISDTGRLIHLTVRLKEAAYQLREVKVLPGINPALRIIRTAIDNRDKNNPEKVHSFTYNSYNKMYCTADLKAPADSVNSLDSSAIKKQKSIVQKKDTSDEFSSLSKFLKEEYLFLVESVSERRFLYPDHNYEKVIAQRTSGMKDSPFALLATQMQSFSFYPDHISILGDDYLNPVSGAGVKRYYYKILDTLYQGKDSVYIISFEPKKNKNFDGMKGVLYINTRGYAIQNVIAQPVRRTNNISIHIQQKYEYIANKQWFPAQLNTDWVYNNIRVSDSNVEGTNKAANPDDEHNKIKIVTRSYIRDITLDTNLRKRDFGRVEVEIAKDAGEKADEYLNKYRIDTLTNKEKKTYHVIDSIGTAIHLDRKIKWYETLATGKLREGIVDWDLDKILTYNGYEKFRLGAGLHTNDVLSRYVSIGGYGAYGFGDMAFKYGGDIGFILNPYSQVKLNFSYKNDVIEAGGVSFFNDQQFLSTESYRDYFINNMDKIQEEKVSFSFDAFKYFQFNLFGDDQLQQTTNSYMFGINDNNVSVLSNQFGFAEIGMGIRFAYNEKFLKSSLGMISLGTKYPIVWVNITKGINGLLDGQYSYMKYDLKINKDFHIPQAGVSSVEVLAGYVQGNIPYTMLYNVRATYMASWESRVAVDNTFQTMNANEFLSNRYIDVFLSHDFQSFLYRSKKFNPHLRLVTNMGWGDLDNISSHYNYSFKIMDKGYYESGIELNNLIKSSIVSLGVGGYYRYGPYALSTPINNFVAKLTIHIGL